MRPATIVLVVLILLAAVWLVLVNPALKHQATPSQPAKPLAPKPAEVQAAEAFLDSWSKGDSAAVYGMLSTSMKQLIPQDQYAAQMAEMKISNPTIVAHTETAPAAFAIAKFTATQPAGSAPVQGASILLKPEQGQWKIALFVTLDKVAQKYEDLKIAPGKDKGWVVTYQDEKGQVGTTTLPEL
ncbi:MAG: hypothetical protein ABFE08_16605 [Armatimonadia bacterium]